MQPGVTVNLGSGNDNAFVQPITGGLTLTGGGQTGDGVYLYASATGALGGHTFATDPVGGDAGRSTLRPRPRHARAA